MIFCKCGTKISTQARCRWNVTRCGKCVRLGKWISPHRTQTSSRTKE